jgi:hypothetical protein
LVQIVSNFKQNRSDILRSKGWIVWICLVWLAAVISCKKESNKNDDTFLRPVVEDLALSIQANTLNISMVVKRAEVAQITVSDAFGNSVQSSFSDLNYEGESLEVNYALISEGFLESTLSVRLQLNNSVGGISQSQTVQYFPFDQSKFGVLIENANGVLTLVSTDSGGVVHSQIIPYTKAAPLWYVSSSYNPLLLYASNGTLSKKRLYDTLSVDLNQTVFAQGDALPAIETDNQVLIPFTSGEYLVFPKDVSNFTLVPSTFGGVLMDVFVHQAYLIQIYESQGSKYFVVSHIASQQIVQSAKPYTFDYAFSNGNDLIFVRESEGGFYNYTAYDIEKKQFDIIANSEKFVVESKVAASNGFAFVGTYNGRTGLFNISGSDMTPQLQSEFILDNYFVYPHESLFASALTLIPDQGSFRVETTKSSDFPVNVDVVLSADDFINVRSMYLMPY